MAAIIANSIDEEVAGEDIERALESYGIEVIKGDAGDFYDYVRNQTIKRIVILGGHRAYDGIGNIVSSLLTPKEKWQVDRGGGVFVKEFGGKEVIVIAGSDRFGTREFSIGDVDEDRTPNFLEAITGTDPRCPDVTLVVEGWNELIQRLEKDVEEIDMWRNVPKGPHGLKNISLRDVCGDPYSSYQCYREFDVVIHWGYFSRLKGKVPKDLEVTLTWQKEMECFRDEIKNDLNKLEADICYLHEFTDLASKVLKKNSAIPELNMLLLGNSDGGPAPEYESSRVLVGAIENFNNGNASEFSLFLNLTTRVEIRISDLMEVAEVALNILNWSINRSSEVGENIYHLARIYTEFEKEFSRALLWLSNISTAYLRKEETSRFPYLPGENTSALTPQLLDYVSSSPIRRATLGWMLGNKRISPDGINRRVEKLGIEEGFYSALSYSSTNKVPCYCGYTGDDPELIREKILSRVPPVSSVDDFRYIMNNFPGVKRVFGVSEPYNIETNFLKEGEFSCQVASALAKWIADENIMVSYVINPIQGCGHHLLAAYDPITKYWYAIELLSSGDPATIERLPSHCCFLDQRPITITIYVFGQAVPVDGDPRQLGIDYIPPSFYALEKVIGVG